MSLDHLKIVLIKLLLQVIGLVQGSKYKYSQVYEDNFKYMDWQEKLWWGYKALIRQIENGEKGKNIEAYFANQNLDFEPDPSFKVISRLSLTAGGDLSASEVIYPESTLHLWDDVAGFYFEGDIVCANLESPLDASKPYSGVPEVCLTAPDLNTTPAMFERFVVNGRGINFFATANNHSLDQGEAGLVATLDFLDSRGYPHVGTARTPEEQMAIPVIEKNGLRIAFLSYTYSLNKYDPIPGKEYMTNLIRLNKPDTDIGLIQRHVKIAREQKADLIVAMLHWSIEFETYPLENIIHMGHRIMECGIDIILGSHPHVAQPMEKYSFRDPETGQLKNGFITNSLGELLSYNAFSKNSRLAFLLKLDIAKGFPNGNQVDQPSDTVSEDSVNHPDAQITGLKVLPIYTWIRHFPDGSHDYRLLDFRKLLLQLQNGENPHGFSAQEITEFHRLERLLYQKLLPRNSENLFP